MANIDPSHSQVGNDRSPIYQISEWDKLPKIDKGIMLGGLGGILTVGVGAPVLGALAHSVPLIAFALMINPIGAPLAGLVALICIMGLVTIVTDSLVGGESRKFKVQELVKRDLSRESVKDKLAQHLRSWAEEGEIKNLKTLLEYELIDPQKKEQIVEIFLNGQGEDGKSTMDLLVQQKIPDFLYLLAEDQFDKANHIHSEIVQWGIGTDVNGAISLESKEFFTHLAMVNYDLAKACLNDTLVDSALFKHTVFEKINDSDTREAFINAIDQGTYQLPQVELIVQRYLRPS